MQKVLILLFFSILFKHSIAMEGFKIHDTDRTNESDAPKIERIFPKRFYETLGKNTQTSPLSKLPGCGKFSIFAILLSFLENMDILEFARCSLNILKKIKSSGTILTLNGTEYPFLKVVASSVIPNYSVGETPISRKNPTHRVFRNLDEGTRTFLENIFDAKSGPCEERTVTLVSLEFTVYLSDTYKFAYVLEKFRDGAARIFVSHQEIRYDGRNVCQGRYGPDIHCANILLLVKKIEDNMFLMYIRAGDLVCVVYFVEGDSLKREMLITKDYEEQKQTEIMQAMIEEAEKCETKEDIKGLLGHRCYSAGLRIILSRDREFALERKNEVETSQKSDSGVFATHN